MDVIYDLDLGISDTPEVVLLDKSLEHKRLDDYDGSVDLLKPVLRKGMPVDDNENIHATRQFAIDASDQFYNTHGETNYAVALEKKLFHLKHELIDKLK